MRAAPLLVVGFVAAADGCVAPRMEAVPGDVDVGVEAGEVRRRTGPSLCQDAPDTPGDGAVAVFGPGDFLVDEPPGFAIAEDGVLVGRPGYGHAVLRRVDVGCAPLVKRGRCGDRWSDDDADREGA